VPVQKYASLPAAEIKGRGGDEVTVSFAMTERMADICWS
jgi:hypothetical protein